MLWAVVVRGMLRIVDIANGKRQNIFSIFRDFVLLLVPCGGLLKAAVDKKRSFCFVFVYFEVHAGDF